MNATNGGDPWPLQREARFILDLIAEEKREHALGLHVDQPSRFCPECRIEAEEQ